jgi:hypothetical protein
MRITRRRLLVLVSVGVAGLTLWLTLSNAAATKPQTAAKRSAGCRLAAPQPAEPLELNLVGVKVGSRQVAKAIAMEKEVFICESSIKDVETFIEWVQARSGSGMTLPSLRVDQASCEKSYRGLVSCKSRRVIVGPPSNPLKGCKPLPMDRQPAAPVRMSSVVFDPLVTTVKVEKEIWACPRGIGDVYLFTEIVEATPGKVRPSFFEGIVCLKSESEAELVRCDRIKIAQ